MRLCAVWRSRRRPGYAGIKIIPSHRRSSIEVLVQFVIDDFVGLSKFEFLPILVEDVRVARGHDALAEVELGLEVVAQR